MGKKAKSSDSGIDPNAWMVTFGDLVTLLLTFFVLLLTMASMDNQKFKDFANDSSGSFINLMSEDIPAGTSFVEIPQLDILRKLKSSIEPAIARVPKNLSVSVMVDGKPMYYHVQAEGEGKFTSDEGTDKMVALDGGTEDPENAGFSRRLILAAEGGGIRITVPDSIAFDPGNSDLKEEAREMIRTVLRIASASGWAISVLAHTGKIQDDSKDGVENLRLSCARGAAVAGFSDEENILLPGRIRIAGLGSTRSSDSVLPTTGSESEGRLELWMEPAEVWALSGEANVPMTLFARPHERGIDVKLIPDEDPVLEGIPDFDPTKQIPEL